MNLDKKKYFEKSDGNYFNYHSEKSEWTFNPDDKSKQLAFLNQNILEFCLN